MCKKLFTLLILFLLVSCAKNDFIIENADLKSIISKDVNGIDDNNDLDIKAVLGKSKFNLQYYFSIINNTGQVIENLQIEPIIQLTFKNDFKKNIKLSDILYSENFKTNQNKVFQYTCNLDKYYGFRKLLVHEIKDAKLYFKISARNSIGLNIKGSSEKLIEVQDFTEEWDKMSYYYKNGYHKTFLEVFNNYSKEVNALNKYYVNELNISTITGKIFNKDTLTFKLRRNVGECFNNSNSYNYKIKNLLKFCFDDFSKIDSSIPNGAIIELKSYVKEIDKINSLENKVCEELLKYNAFYENGGNYEGQPYIAVYKNNEGVVLNNVELKEFVTKYQNEIVQLKKTSTIHYLDAMISLARNNNQDEIVKTIKIAKYKIN